MAPWVCTLMPQKVLENRRYFVSASPMENNTEPDRRGFSFESQMLSG